MANLAFSTTSFLKPKELLKQLENVDVDVLWMPLYAGELKSIKKVDYMESGKGECVCRNIRFILGTENG